MRLARTLLVVLLTLTASAAWGQFVPDHERTPGAIDPGIKQENIADTICIPRLHKDSAATRELYRPPQSLADARAWATGNSSRLP